MILWLVLWSSMTIAFQPRLLGTRRHHGCCAHSARQTAKDMLLSSSHAVMIMSASTLFSPRRRQAQQTSPLSVLFWKQEGEIQPEGGDNDASCASCACGSGLAYKACCGPLHVNATVYAAANASQVVRARYTAYAYGLVDFIVQSTHPENELFDDLDKFHAIVAQIQEYNAQTLEYRKCEVVMEEYNRPFLSSTKGGGDASEVALVRSRTYTWHLERQQETITTEDSAFTRLRRDDDDDDSARTSGGGGGWLYRGGEAWSNARPYGMY